MSHSNEVVVCTVDGAKWYGSPKEAEAAHLDKGDRIVVGNTTETVSYTWFYEGVIIQCDSGRTVFPALGETFEVVTDDTT